MGFFEPAPPPFDLEEWKAKPHLERLKPLVQDWGGNGFGSPTFVYFVYVIKLVVYVVGAFLVISLTPGLGVISDIGDWWTEPIVCPRSWLRTGTVRLPPWPDRVPFTKGNTRTPVDVFLYAGVIASAIFRLAASGVDAAGTSAGKLPPA